MVLFRAKLKKIHHLSKRIGIKNVNTSVLKNYPPILCDTETSIRPSRHLYLNASPSLPNRHAIK